MSPAKLKQFPLRSILSLLKWLKRQISIQLPLPTDGAGPRTDDYSRTMQAESACLGFAYTALYITIREEFHWQSSASIQVSLQTCPHIATETHSAGTQRVMKGPWGSGRQRWHQMSLTPCSSPPSTSPSSPEWLLWRCHKTELGKKMKEHLYSLMTICFFKSMCSCNPVLSGTCSTARYDHELLSFLLPPPEHHNTGECHHAWLQ